MEEVRGEESGSEGAAGKRRGAVPNDAAGKRRGAVPVIPGDGRGAWPVVPGDGPGVWLAGPGGRPARVLARGSAPFGEIVRAWLTHGLPAGRVRLVVQSGDAATDATLGALAPAFVAILERLTGRQREVARMLLLDGRRRAQIAEALGISRPTVSVMVDRARLADLPGIAAALDALFKAGASSAPPAR